MKTIYFLPVGSALALAFIIGCGGAGTATLPEGAVQHAWGESQLKAGVRLTPDALVALNLEPAGGAPTDGDTGADGEDRIPYRLEKDSHVIVEMDPEDPMYITLIASKTGKLVFEVGPETPKVEMDLPAADYDLYVHSTSGETIPVFAQGQKVAPKTRGAFEAWWQILFKRSCQDCDMRGGHFALALWDGVDLSRADLTGAIISGSMVKEIKLVGANLTRARLHGLNLGYADLTNANLTQTRIEESSVQAATYKGAKFENTVFIGGNLNGINLTSIGSWDSVEFIDTDMRGARLPLSTIGNSTFQQVQLDGVNFSGSTFRGMTFDRCTMTNASLDRSNWSTVRIFKCNLTGAKMNGGNYTEMKVEHSVLDKVSLSQSTFTGRMEFSNAIEMNASLTAFRGYYTGNNFSNADLRGAQFDGAFNNGNKFDGARLSGAFWFDRRTCAAGSITYCE